jgi:hypothetical protein
MNAIQTVTVAITTAWRERVMEPVLGGLAA